MEVLTRREAEVHAHLLTAASMKQIAHQMGITLGSSKVITHRLYGKLGIHDRFAVMAAEIDRLKSAAAGLT